MGLRIKDPFPIKDKLPSEELSDLVTRFRAGDSSVEGQLILVHTKTALAAASYFGAFRPAVIDDLIGEAMLELVRSVKNAKNKLKDNNLTAWVAFHVNRKLKQFLLEDCTIRTPWKSGESLKRHQCPDLEDRPIKSDLEDSVRKILLDEIDSQIFSLRYDGYSDVEISSLLNLTPRRIGQRRQEMQKRFLKIVGD